MNISVKKFSKKSLSLLIALIMVFSALPLTPPISASAATSTIQMTAMGCFRNGNDNRVGTDYVSVCNDSQNTNFDIAVFNFNISSLSFKTYDEVSAMFNYYTQLTQSENKGVSFYYPTAHLSEFEIVNNYVDTYQDQPNSSIWTGDDGKHLSRAISYYGLQPLQLGITTSSTKTTGNLDIGAAIKFAKLQGNSIATAVAVIASAGQSGKTGGWTDTSVGYSSKSVTVNITEVSAKEYVKQNIDNVKTSYPNISENNAGSFASNLVVADSWGSIADNTFAVDNDKNNDDTIKVHGYSNAVAIYTGSNSVKFPVVFEKVANSDQSSSFDLYQQIEHVALENGDSFSLGSIWEYCNSPTDFTSKTLTTTTGDYVRNISSDINTTLTTDQGVNDKKDINTAKNDKFATELGKSFKNYIAYNGTGNTSLYYDKLSAPVFDYQADYAVYWYDGRIGERKWKLTMVNQKIADLNSGLNYYVINMKPLLDITTNSTFKSNFSNVYKNESKYETTSLNAYYETMADIVAFDLTSRGLDTEQKIASVAKEIKDLVDSYKLPELKKYTVTFYDVTGSAVVKTLTVTPGTTIYERDLPKITSPTYYQNKHRVYYWAYSDNTEFTVPLTVNNDIDVKEIFRLEECKLAVKSIDGNTSTVSCSVCNGGTYTLDIKAYRDIVSVAQEAINDKAKYDSASRANLETVLNNNNTVNDCITMEQINAKISAIQTAITALVPEKYSVTLHYYDSTGTPLFSKSGNIKEIVSDIPYGKLQPISVSGKFNENYVVYKWTRDVDGQNKISGLNSDTLNVVVKENADYYVFLKNTTVDTDTTKNAVITLNNKSNKVVDIGYLDKTSGTASVMISDNTITVGGVKLTAPNYSFYTISGFTINGQPVTSGDSITITDKIVIKPVYEPTLDAFIKRAENETFLINGKAENLAVKWNQKVVLNTIDGTEVAWIAGIDRDGNGTIDSTEKNVVGYGSSYSFYANSNVTFYTELTTVGDPKTSIGLFSYNANENKVTLVNNFYAPSGYTVKYAGVVLSTKTDNRDKLIEQTNGRFFGGESDFSGTDSNKNQIRISVSRTANTNFDMHALAYIIVQKPDGTEETVYADNVETIHYTATV